MQLKKSLGQNFLNNKHIIKKIIDVAQVISGNQYLEIGPGDGALTALLLAEGAKLTAVETDNRMIELLSEKFSSYIDSNNFTLTQADIAEWDEVAFAELFGTYSIVANIPYYITGLIIRKFLTSTHQPQDMTLIMQREVADRIMAREGKLSLLSIGVQVYGKPEFHGMIKRGNFTPAPKVDSAILKISNISRDFFIDCDEDLFWKHVHAGFAHKRKQLISNLRDMYERADLESFFTKNKIPHNIRAEDMTLDTWKAITQWAQ